jgi:Gpi18-like mannosyltransferase
MSADYYVRRNAMPGAKLGKNKGRYARDYEKWFLPLFFLIISFRIIITCIKPYQIDMAGYMAWSSYLAEHGPDGFYTSGFHVVYAPFFLYFLWITGELCKALSLSGALQIYLIKFWSVLFEFIGALLIVQLSKKYKKTNLGMLLALTYVINPGVFINSSIWGQFDSIPATMLIGVLALFEYKKPNLAALLFLVAVLTKPQSGLLLPVVLYLYFRDLKFDFKSFIRLFSGIFSGIAVYLAIVIPFYVPTQLSGKLPTFIDYFYWLFDLYFTSIKDYPFASANAFNFWFLLGGQIQNDSMAFLGLSYLAWGNILLALGIAYAFICLIKGKATLYSITYFSYLVLFSSFFFMTKMHERYLLPAIIFITLASVFDKRHLLTLCLISFSVFINHQYLYIISFGEVYWLERWDGLSLLYSFITLITYAVSLYQGYRAFIKPDAVS